MAPRDPVWEDAVKLTPAVWKAMDEPARAAYRERNMLLWQIVRAVFPHASGDVDEFIPRVLDRLCEHECHECAGLDACREAVRDAVSV